MSGLPDNGGQRKAPPPLPSRWGRVAPLLSFLACCQSLTPQASHEVLNTITAIGQPTYELVAAWCQSKQWAIVVDDAIGVQEKSQLIAVTRRECHDLYAGFEDLILSQKEARILLDADNETEAFQTVIHIRQQLIELQTRSLEVVHALGSQNL